MHSDVWNVELVFMVIMLVFLSYFLTLLSHYSTCYIMEWWLFD